MITINKASCLDAPIKVDALNGVAFTKEQGAHQFVVSCYQNGEKLNLTGTITGKFICNGRTIEIALDYAGIDEDGNAWVILTQHCYDYAGRFQLAIFNTVGDTTFCIYACVGNVQTSQIGDPVDGGEIIDSVETLIQEIDEAVQSIPPQYSELVQEVSDLKSAKANYNAVGFNQWDEVWEIGGITNDGTDNNSVTNTIRSKNFIPVFDNFIYYFHCLVRMWVHCYDASYTHLGMLYNGSSFSNVTFALITGTKYIRFAMNAYGTTYNNDICINISQPNTSVIPHNGQYISYSGSEPVYNRVLKDEADEITYRNMITGFNNVSKSISEFPGVELKTGYNTSATSVKINITALASMDTYIYFMPNSVTLYFDNNVIASDGYLSICKVENASRGSETEIFGTSGARYRKSDNNLPTSTNPLSLPAGSAIAITVPTGTDVAIVTNGLFRTLSDYILLDDDQTDNKMHISFNGTMFSVDMRNSKLYIDHQTNNTIRQDVWRVYRGTIISNGAEYDMWNGSDADGVVILNGESDFIGGHHGDEITTKVTCFIDGVEHPIATAFNKKEFTEFNLYVESDVYHCIDSAESSIKAFTRNKIITINENGCAITNYWKAVSSVDVKTAYMGMLSVAKALVTNYSMNSDSAIRDNETLYPGASYCNKAKMQLSTGNVIEYSMTDGSNQSPWGYGQIYSGTGVSNRVKAYFAEIFEDTYKTLNIGDVIRACSTMKIY